MELKGKQTMSREEVGRLLERCHFSKIRYTGVYSINS